MAGSRIAPEQKCQAFYNALLSHQSSVIKHSCKYKITKGFKMANAEHLTSIMGSLSERGSYGAALVTPKIISHLHFQEKVLHEPPCITHIMLAICCIYCELLSIVSA